MNYRIDFHPEAKTEFLELDGRLQKLVAKKIVAIARHPESGPLLGNKAGIDLSGLRKAYVDKKRVRIVYQVREEKIVVFIMAIGKREEMEVYKTAEKRKSKKTR